MANPRSKSDCTLLDMLIEPTRVAAGEGRSAAVHEHAPEDGYCGGAPVTHSFLEALFSSLWEDIHVIKKELLSDLHEVRRVVDAIGERVSHLEDQSTIEQFQQGILRLRDQLIDLLSHIKDLENQSRRNNICMKGVPTGAEGTDIEASVQDLFGTILEASPIWRFRW
ncbi:hypothetical protein NDU88_003685 [Pleurodeles waltl]|uniref:Uncharacterized protein n=1 Tax=Pleurodeles waltl TaxID=8319 RepID=A0AAV7NHC4_PLEWA|nr:hypothetical protein NDU88_003685 [Pleurodeles waltl]